jgi:hypothetical protein
VGRRLTASAMHSALEPGWMQGPEIFGHVGIRNRLAGESPRMPAAHQQGSAFAMELESQSSEHRRARRVLKSAQETLGSAGRVSPRGLEGAVPR